MSDCKIARPHDHLVAEILDVCLPKSEREHAAAREIEQLIDYISKLEGDLHDWNELQGCHCLRPTCHVCKKAEQTFELFKQGLRWVNHVRTKN